jgi:hypothetical protein
MGDIYFGAVSGGTLLSQVPEWIVNTILPSGTAIRLPITEPAGLFVVKKTNSPASYVAIAETSETGETAETAGSGAAVTILSADRATPFRVFVRAGVHYIQIPAGPLDLPSRNKITVLAPKEGTGHTLVIREMGTKEPVPSFGWRPATQ